MVVERFQILNKTINANRSNYSYESLKIIRFGGFNLDLNNYNLYGFQHISYKSKLYTYLYFRLTNESEYYPRYIVITRRIYRLGFKTGESGLIV